MWMSCRCCSGRTHLFVPVSVSVGMCLEEWPQTQGSVGMGRKGPLALWGVIYPTPKGGGTIQGPPALLSWSTGLRGGGVCLCVSLAKHFRVPQTRCPRWGPHLALVDLVSPTHAVTTLERSPWLAQGNVPERSVCALVRVDLDTAWS